MRAVRCERFSMIQSSTVPCCATMFGNVRIHIEHLRLLAFHGQIELDRAGGIVWIGQLLRKVQVPHAHRRTSPSHCIFGGGRELRRAAQIRARFWCIRRGDDLRKHAVRIIFAAGARIDCARNQQASLACGWPVTMNSTRAPGGMPRCVCQSTDSAASMLHRDPSARHPSPPDPAAAECD